MMIIKKSISTCVVVSYDKNDRTKTPTTKYFRSDIFRLMVHSNGRFFANIFVDIYGNWQIDFTDKDITLEDKDRTTINSWVDDIMKNEYSFVKEQREAIKKHKENGYIPG